MKSQKNRRESPQWRNLSLDRCLLSQNCRICFLRYQFSSEFWFFSLFPSAIYKVIPSMTRRFIIMLQKIALIFIVSLAVSICLLQWTTKLLNPKSSFRQTQSISFESVFKKRIVEGIKLTVDPNMVMLSLMEEDLCYTHTHTSIRSRWFVVCLQKAQKIYSKTFFFFFLVIYRC